METLNEEQPASFSDYRSAKSQSFRNQAERIIDLKFINFLQPSKILQQRRCVIS